MSDLVLHPATCAPPAASILRRPFAAIVTRFRRWVLVQRTYRELADLPDEMLKDLGINRGEIAFIAERSHPR
jgi:uncharacterized protein YjiS (DUF1127 family)